MVKEVFEDMSLNPYCIGSRSWTSRLALEKFLLMIVLILIVLEVGLGPTTTANYPQNTAPS